MTRSRDGLVMAIALMRCGGGSTEGECGELDEADCLARDGECAPVYTYGACDGCPAIFRGCRVADGEVCVGEAEWTCGEVEPPCAAGACAPAPNDACLAVIAPGDCAAPCEPSSFEARDEEERVLWRVEECRPARARADCEELDGNACAERADCVVRTFCRREIQRPGEPSVCREYCRAPCDPVANNCEDYQICQPAPGLGMGVATCETTEASCAASARCSLP
ncbi:MAG: hypothetical protein AABZ30_11840 [Myxococcota bacterium]